MMFDSHIGMESESVSEDVAIFNRDGIPAYRMHEPYKQDKDVFIICSNGTSVTTINNREVTIGKGNIAFVRSGQTIFGNNVSDDFQSIVVSLSKRFTDEILPISTGVTIPKVDCVLFKLEENEMTCMLRLLSELKNMTKITNTTFLYESLSHFFLMLYFTFMAGKVYLHETHIESSAQKYVSNFFSLLKIHFRTKHTVNDYAEMLCVTCNYLSALVMQQTKRTAKSWIKHYLIIEAKALLNSTGKNVKTIAYELNFSTPTAFCKFFKTETKLSPLQYKEIWANNVNTNPLNL